MTSDPARPFGRVLTAMVTPLAEDGSIDLAGAQELAAHLVDRQSHDGLVVFGTTGESPTISDAEQHAVLEVVLDAVGDRATVIAGVGTNDTAHSIEKARSAARLGVHGLLARPDLAYSSGEDMLTLPLLSLGAVGVVSVVGHLVGPRLAELIAAVESGDLVMARAINQSLLPVYTGIFRSQGVIMVKAALRELALPSGPVRPPLVDATPEQVAKLREDLIAGGIAL